MTDVCRDERRGEVWLHPRSWPFALSLAIAAENNWQLAQLTPLHTTLEEVFVKITSDNANLPKRPQGSSPKNIVAPNAPCFERGPQP